MEVRRKYSRDTKITGGIRHAYKFYKNKYKNSEINYDTYSEICYLFNKIISDKIITQSFRMRLFYNLGHIRIKAGKVKIKINNNKIVTTRHSINWVETKKLWQRIYETTDMEKLKNIKNKKLIIHVNEHSNGYIMRWYWDKHGIAKQNNSLYQFKPVKGGISPDGYYYGKRGLAAWIKNDNRTNNYYM